MSVTVAGLSSVADRTLYTKRGPIAKPAVDLLTGSDLRVVGPNEVSSDSGPFAPSHVGKQLRISGSPGGRNDGTYEIVEYKSSRRVVLAASLDHSDVALTTASISALANDLKDKFNLHRASPAHGEPDVLNQVTAPLAVDLTSSLTLLNQLRAKLLAHVQLTRPYHVEQDDDFPDFNDASTLGAAVHLANELRRKLELHRQDDAIHNGRDGASRVTAGVAAAVVGSGPLCGPFTWTVVDPRKGMIADDPSDVSVIVNGSPAEVEAVFGLLGAVVLKARPASGSTVTADYSYIVDPPTQMGALNTPEYNLTQVGTIARSGFPAHRYRARAYLMDPSNTRGVLSPVGPRQVGWKYKAFQRAHTASLNDPTTLLLNVPTNRLTIPVFDVSVPERTLRYDPTSLPDASFDAWSAVGEAAAYVDPAARELVVPDDGAYHGTASRPSFYLHPVEMTFPSTVNCAFRVSATGSIYDGVWAGPSFGFSDGERVAFCGLLLTEASNLSSAIVLANSVRSLLSAHLIQPAVHAADDLSGGVDVVAADDLASLLILSNRIRAVYGAHIARGAPVHAAPDTANALASPEATTLDGAIALLNEVRAALNAHLSQPGVHNADDSVNAVPLVRQVGMLKAGGAPQLLSGWECSASDWSGATTYRIARDSTGAASLYCGGDAVPAASLPRTGLPAPSDVDAQFDVAQFAFFGQLSRSAASSSRWALVRVNVAPVESRAIGDNKSVEYNASYVPEADPVTPWITVGQGGWDRIASSRLLLDSTAFALDREVQALGLLSGAYRGFLRVEPLLSQHSAASLEFEASVGYSTFGVDNRAAGVFLDDGELSVHLCFIQATPTPATVAATIAQPYPISGGDTLIFALGAEPALTASFPYAMTAAADVAAVINAAAGRTIASASSGRVVLSHIELGAGSKITVFGGLAAEKLGLRAGTYFGSDSRPEPKVSWFGANYPDGETPPWIPAGSQPVEARGRSLVISDSSTADFRVYTFDDPMYVEAVLSSDWKLDARMAVHSWSPSDPVVTGSNLKFAGALVSVDEGPAGKNVELQLAVDSSGVPYVNVLTYSASLNQMVSVAEFPFNWADGATHCYNVYTSKAAGVCTVLADGAALGTFPYSSLLYGVAGPSVTFGSGANAVLNADLRGATSVVHWQSVCVFRDSKVADPDAASRRYVGIYRGGDPAVLSSYYLHQVDWSLNHRYRIVRDPVSAVSLFVDGASVPSISVNYDTLTLPPSSASFLKDLSAGRPVVAFGAFDPFEVSRTSWGYVRYSVGRITLDGRTVTGHQVLSRAHVVASPDHLGSAPPHLHLGSAAYSEGTPPDDFMADGALAAHTVLGEGTAPVPMTQDLESRGGHVKSATTVASTAVGDIVDFRGFLAELEDDTYNTPGQVPLIQYLIDEANQQRSLYEEHRVARATISGSTVPVHAADDTVNAAAAPAASDVASLLVLLEDLRVKFNAHTAEPGVHAAAPTGTVAGPAPANLDQALSMLVALRSALDAHAGQVKPHKADDARVVSTPDPVGVDPPTLIALAGEIREDYSGHIASLFQHEVADPGVLSLPQPVDLATAIAVLNEVRAAAPLHRANLTSHRSEDVGLSVSSPAAFDYASAVALAVELKSELNAHFLAPGSHKARAPYSVPAVLPADPTIASVNELLESYNSHLGQYRVHLNNQPDGTCALTAASTTAGAIAVANELKRLFNLHRVARVREGERVHLADDTFNAVSAADATDLDSLRALDWSLWLAFRDHLVHPGVHGSPVFIRLEAPDRVLYGSMKFFTETEGQEGLLSPFADDDAVATLTNTTTMEQVIIRY